MAQRPSVVTAEVTSVPDPTEISRVADFVREPFVEEGEDAAAVLAPGSIRRHAFEAARNELDAGAEVPSQKWRRRWSLLLGLDRTLNATTPVLADGTTLNPHQIDALSGTYAALLADAQRRASGGSGSDGDALLLSFEDEDPTELEEPPARLSAEDDDEGHSDDGHDDEEPSAEDEDDELESIDEQLVELPDAEPESESSLYDDLADEDVDEDIDRVALEDPNAHKRFWFEHATGAGKTVAAMGFVEACRTGGILILTHRRNLVDQFQDELRTRGYGERLSKPLLTDEDGKDPNPDVLGPVTIETYQWFVRNAGRISGAYTVVICDEAHTALGDKTSAAIRAWTGPIFIGMTATGALIARHVADLFPTQTSRFDLAQAARRGVIAPLRCLRIPPGPGVRTIAKVPLRKGEVDMEFDQDELAKLLDQAPFNLAIADLYKTRFRNTPGVVYTAGVQHAYNVAESFRALGMKAQAVSGETPKRELATILAQYDAGEIDVLINAQLLAEGWNSPRATICMHLAPTASKRIYQQRVGRVTRRHPGKEAGVVIDFVHPATPNDDPVVTLHSLLDRDVYRGGAIVVGPVRRGRGRRVKVERRVLPVTPDIERRRQVFERELWRIAVEQLDWGEQRVWAALAGAKASPANWRRGRAMLNFDRSGELRRQFLITALERNRSPQLRMRAIQEIALLREAEPFDTAIDFIGQWPRDERREASRTMLQAMADRRIGRRDQATAWIWRLAEYTRDVHEEYAAQRWPATKHLLGLLVNSSGAAHARNARRLVHGARQHDRRLQAALLAAAVAHTPEAEEVLREARTRLARKPGALSRDLLKDFPNGKRRKKRTRKRRGGGGANGEDATTTVATDGTTTDAEAAEGVAANGGSGENGSGNNGNGNAQNGSGNGGSSRSRRGRSRGGRRRNRGGNGAAAEATPQGEAVPQAADGSVDTSAASEATPLPVRDPDVPVASDDAPPARRRRVRGQKAAAEAAAEAASATTPEGSDGASSTAASAEAGSATEAAAEPKPAARRTRTRTRKTAAEKAAEAETAAASVSEAPAAAPVEAAAPAEPAAEATPAEQPVRRTRTRKTAAEKAAEAAAAEAPAADTAPAASVAEAPAEKPVRATRTRKTAAQKAAEAAAAEAPAASEGTAAAEAPAASEATATAKPVRATRTRKTAAQKAAEAAAVEAPAASAETPTAKAAARRTTTRKTAAQKAAEAAAVEAPAASAETPTAKAAARRTTTRKTAAQKAAEAAETPATDDATPAKKPAARKPATRKTAAQKAAEAAAAEVPAASDATPAEKPARPTRTRKTAAQKAAEAAAADGVEDAPAKKPAARRTTAAAKTTAATKATATTAAKKPTPRKTAAQKAAEAAAETAADVPAKKPTARKTTTAAKTTTATKSTAAKKPAATKATTAAAKATTARKTTAAKTTSTTAAKKPAARKPAAAKTTAAKTTTARTTTTRRKTTTPPKDE